MHIPERWVSLGISHHNAPVEMRERLAVTPDAWNARAGSLRDLIGPDGGLIVLCTCNRAEWIADLDDQARLFAVVRHLTQAKSPLLWKREGWDVLRHLARVATGLDSMLVGETEIAAQVKKAYAQSIEWKLTSPGLHTLVQQALRISKRARTCSQIDRGRVSLFSLAARLVRDFVESERLGPVIVVGSGSAAESVCRELRRIGSCEIIHRTRHTSNTNQNDLALSNSRLPTKWYCDISRATALITCSGSGQLHCDSQLWSELQKRSTPLLAVDLGVPRNLSHEFVQHENVCLYNIDDLSGRARKHLEDRLSAASLAEALVNQEIQRLRELRSPNDVQGTKSDGNQGNDTLDYLAVDYLGEGI